MLIGDLGWFIIVNFGIVMLGLVEDGSLHAITVSRPKLWEHM